MTMERKDPIPKGVYWMDIAGQERIDRFNAWLKKNSATVESLRQKLDRDFWMESRNQLWVLFAVNSPTKRWPVAAKLGLPTVARSKLVQKRDTEQRPPEKDTKKFWKNWWDENVPDMPEVPDLGPAVLLVGMAYFLTRRKD